MQQSESSNEHQAEPLEPLGLDSQSVPDIPLSHMPENSQDEEQKLLDRNTYEVSIGGELPVEMVRNISYRFLGKVNTKRGKAPRTVFKSFTKAEGQPKNQDSPTRVPKTMVSPQFMDRNQEEPSIDAKPSIASGGFPKSQKPKRDDSFEEDFASQNQIFLEEENKKYNEEDSNVFILKGLRREVENSFLYQSIMLNASRAPPEAHHASFSKMDVTGDITMQRDLTGRRVLQNQSDAEKSLFKDLYNGLSKQNREQRELNLGTQLQESIDSAKRGQLIHVPDEKIVLTSLRITKPVTLLGSPGTQIELKGGSIVVDFSTLEGEGEASEEPENFKRAEVAIFQECEIIYNRTNLVGSFSPKKTRLRQGSRLSSQMQQDSTQALHKREESKSNGQLGLFLLESDSYLEVKDCNLKSMKDHVVPVLNSDGTLKQDESDELDLIQDSAFIMNYQSQQNQQNSVLSQQPAQQEEFVGVISLQSTTISDFYFGVLSGPYTLLNCDKSTFLNMRGTAVKVDSPKVLKLTSCIFQKILLSAVDISLGRELKQQQESNQSLSVASSNQSEVQRKVMVSSNRMIQCQEHAVRIRDPQLRQAEHNDIQIKVIYNKIYNTVGDAILLQNLRVRQVDVSNNDILKNQQNGIFIQDVVCGLGNRGVKLKDNSISENLEGNGIQLANSSAVIEASQIVKNGLNAIQISSTPCFMMQRNQKTTESTNYVSVLLTLIQDNKKNGISVSDYDGFLEIENSVINYNQEHGVLLNQVPSYPNPTFQTNSGEALETVKSQHEEELDLRRRTQGSPLKNELHQRRAHAIIYNSEIWANKGDGLRVKQFKTHLLNCKIKQNLHGAIYFSDRNSEHMLKIYCSDNWNNSRGANSVSYVKGKIQGTQGLVSPQIMLQENIAELMEEIRMEGHQFVGRAAPQPPKPERNPKRPKKEKSGFKCFPCTTVKKQ